MKKKVCVITSSRADYGQLRKLITGISKSTFLDLELIVTGSHLSKDTGFTLEEISNDGVQISETIDLLLTSDGNVGVTQSIGHGMAGFASVLENMRPDLVVLLGDRFETLAAALAITIFRIPLAHIHGGELTGGAIDDTFRHSLTKMSHIHFVANNEYRRRVIQLGEQPKHVHMVGGLGADCINSMQLLTLEELEESLEFSLGENNLLVTLHPETLTPGTSESYTRTVLSALDTLDDTKLIFSAPNADMENKTILSLIEDYVRGNPMACLRHSLGQERYLSCLRFVDGIVGNSSSGLTEMPSFNKGTINIGTRQDGRLKSTSVIDCKFEHDSIVSALNILYSRDFQTVLKTSQNPYDQGDASNNILCILEQYNLSNILNKSFYDLNQII